MKLRFLGGCREIGRIAVSVKSEGSHVILDYGVIFNDQPGFPMHVPPKEVDAIILTHAHLDHSGGVTIFHVTSSVPLYGTDPTFDLMELLISDFIKISGYYLPFEYLDLKSVMRSSTPLNLGEKRRIGDMDITLLSSGHIPGGCQVLIETDDKRLLYTGDFNTIDTRLLKGAETDYGELDALIIESTYADEEHPERSSLEKEFVARVKEVVEGGGVVLVPAFSVGRSQEVACVLKAYNIDCPVTIDGMARKVNNIFMRHSSTLGDPMLYRDTMHNIRQVEGWRERRKAMKTPGVIISPAGMLKGGPAVSYAQNLGKKKENAIFLVGYQIQGTPGRNLLEKGVFVINGKIRKVKAGVEKFDFSSHCGTRELRETVEKLEGNPKIYVIHGSDGNCKDFAEWIRDEVGLDAQAPKTGDTVLI